MASVVEFYEATPELANTTHIERIRALAWHFHSNLNRKSFALSDIREAYTTLGLAEAANFSKLVRDLLSRKELLRQNGGYVLERRVLEACHRKYGRRPAAIRMEQVLADLPLKIPSLTEREFLEETLKCYRAGAFRASIVMAWNLGYDHLCNYALAKHRDLFNKYVSVRFPHKKLKVAEFRTIDDLNEELRESEVIAVCRSAMIITSDVERVLSEKLGKRNSAAHPSTLNFSQTQVDAYIEDLVTNVVLKLV